MSTNHLRPVWRRAALLAPLLAFSPGCVVVERPATAPFVVSAAPDEVVVTQDAPAPLYEVVGVAPGPGFIWVGGFWHWDGRWVWNRGHYARPPHPGARWMGPRYLTRGGARVYVHGYWSH